MLVHTYKPNVVMNQQSGSSQGRLIPPRALSSLLAGMPPVCASPRGETGRRVRQGPTEKLLGYSGHYPSPFLFLFVCFKYMSDLVVQMVGHLVQFSGPALI